MSMTNMEELEKALRLLPEQLAAALRKLPGRGTGADPGASPADRRPVSVFDGSSSRFLSRTGRLHSFPAQGDWTLSRREVEDCFYRLCEFSVHTHQQELSQGFVTTSWGGPGGCVRCNDGRSTGTGRLPGKFLPCPSGFPEKCRERPCPYWNG